MSIASGFGQWEGKDMVAFRLLDTSGTPSVDEVFPAAMSAAVSVVDTATGRATITIKNFKGANGKVRIFLNTSTTSLMANAVSRSYSGQDLSFEISVEDDASTLTDATVDVLVLAY